VSSAPWAADIRSAFDAGRRWPRLSWPGPSVASLRRPAMSAVP
jgi:hypothetical protein